MTDMDLVVGIDSSRGNDRGSNAPLKAAVNEVLRSVRPGDRVGVLSFSSRVSRKVGLSDDESIVQKAVEQALRDRLAGKTESKFYDAVTEAASILVGRREMGRRRAVLVLTYETAQTAAGGQSVSQSALLESNAALIPVIVKP